MQFVMPRRQCGTCEHWSRSAARTMEHKALEAPCQLNVINPDLPVKQENPHWHRGSDTCGQWSKESTL